MTGRAPNPSRTTARSALLLVLAMALVACGPGPGAPTGGTTEEARGAVTSTTTYGPEYVAPAVPGDPSASSSAPPFTVPPATPATGLPPTTAAPTSQPPATPTSVLPAGHDTTVTRVTDGDTIVVGGSVRVRLIGMDTPETLDPRTPVQCFGPEASRRTGGLLPAGTPVRLVYDVDRTDRYGRTLAYVYRLSDGLFVNVALVRDGYARTATYPPNVAHVDEIRAAETEARKAARGLWGGCEAAGSTVTTAPPTATTVSPAPATGGACDPSYPDVCVPPAPPDLDCGEIIQRNFRVVGPDPHRFDGNHDGVGCES